MKKCDICGRILAKGESFSKQAIASARMSEMSSVRITVELVGYKSDVCQTCLGRAASSAAVEIRGSHCPEYDSEKVEACSGACVLEVLDTTN